MPLKSLHLLFVLFIGFAGAYSTNSLRGSNVSAPHLPNNETNIAPSMAGSSTSGNPDSHNVDVVSNAVASNMSLTASQNYLFQMGSQDSIWCPVGYEKITTTYACHLGANYYNWPYAGTTNRDDYPGGCYMTHLNVFFNFDKGYQNAHANPLCMLPR